MQEFFHTLQIPTIVISTSNGRVVKHTINRQWSLPLHFLIYEDKASLKNLELNLHGSEYI